MAQRKRCEVNHLVIAWALKQKSMSFALVGAKNPLQISESLLGHTIELTELESLEIDRAIRENRS
jgi:aryl-alcohol dehydrogenase-like predicted oxidoreductase